MNRRLSIVIPAKNEEMNIGRVLADLNSTIATMRVIRHGTRFFWRVFTEWLRNKGLLASNARRTA